MGKYIFSVYVAICILLTSMVTIFVKSAFENYSKLYIIILFLLSLIFLISDDNEYQESTSNYLTYIVKVIWMYFNFIFIYLSIFKSSINLFNLQNVDVYNTLSLYHNKWIFLCGFPFLLWPIIGIAYRYMLKNNIDPKASYYIKYFNNTITTGINILIRQSQFVGVAIITTFMCLIVANYILSKNGIMNNIQMNGEVILVFMFLFGFLYSHTIKKLIRKFHYYDTPFWAVTLSIISIVSMLLITAHLIPHVYNIKEMLSLPFPITINLPSVANFNQHWYLFAISWGISSSIPIGLSLAMWSKNISNKLIILPHLVLTPISIIFLSQYDLLDYIIASSYQWEILSVPIFILYMKFGTVDRLHLLANTTVYSNLKARKTTIALFGVFSAIIYCVLILYINNLGLLSYLFTIVTIPNFIIFILIEIGILMGMHKNKLILKTL